MTENIVIALIAGLPAIVASVTALIVAIRSNRKADAAKEYARALDADVEKHIERLWSGK